MSIPKNPYKPVPLDFVLLELLPERGMVGGVHWKGRRVADLVTQIVDRDPELKGVVTSPGTQARMRVLHMFGYAESFPGSNAQGKIWARTSLGTELLARRDQILDV